MSVGHCRYICGSKYLEIRQETIVITQAHRDSGNTCNLSLMAALRPIPLENLISLSHGRAHLRHESVRQSCSPLLLQELLSPLPKRPIKCLPSLPEWLFPEILSPCDISS
jgi:hypothetical protein